MSMASKAHRKACHNVYSNVTALELHDTGKHWFLRRRDLRRRALPSQKCMGVSRTDPIAFPEMSTQAITSPTCLLQLSLSAAISSNDNSLLHTFSWVSCPINDSILENPPPSESCSWPITNIPPPGKNIVITQAIEGDIYKLSHITEIFVTSNDTWKIVEYKTIVNVGGARHSCLYCNMCKS